MLNWQDIQIQDKQLWGQLQTLWSNSQYSEALAILQESSIVNKWFDAEKINDLTRRIVEAEERDDTQFKASAPITSASSPQNPIANQIWFAIV